MKKDTEEVLNLVKLKQAAEAHSNLGHDYEFFHLTDPSHFTKFSSDSFRLDGLTIVLCLRGHVEMTVNLQDMTLESNTVLVGGPDNLITIQSVKPESIDVYVLVLALNFVRDINLDIKILSNIHFTPKRKPILQLHADEASLLCRYLNLVHYNTKENTDEVFVRSISANLVAATIYQIMQFVNSRLKNPDEEPAQQSRKSNYVREFMKLVLRYHRSERGVAFYASKLFISPKYLSLIIKESTGRSAAEWIDEYVILEAKSLLRFSGKNVQQVAYELNFSNQSAFGKYFKHLTGMSPTQFQRS